MKQSLQLRLGQQITMTPQLQQAIRLLQLSTLDLQTEIQQTLESNIMLETAEEDELDETDEVQDETADERPAESNDEAEITAEEPDGRMEEENDTIPDDLPTDSLWEDTYDSPSASAKDFINEGRATSETLHDYLMWQLDLTPFSELDRTVAVAIIDAVDKNGYLCATLEDIVQSIGGETELTVEDVRVVLRRIQHFDPPGIAARDLKECLSLQLDQLPENTPWLATAKSLVSKFLDVLANRDYTQLVRRMKLTREELHEVVTLIQSLTPRPGVKIDNAEPQYVVPDVFVKKIKGEWRVNLNAETSPRLRVNNHYASLISQVNSRADSESLKTHLQEARWFIKSLKSRHETLLKVTRCIVKRQNGFLDYGEEAMKPLVLHDIAMELDMHESTISRVTTRKYVHTPRGIFELKYFFSSHVSTDTGGECSSTAIRAYIKKLIAVENSAKPLSDSKIANLLLEQGIKVARRTVAKYRESMFIPPSNERKCIIVNTKKGVMNNR
ncbi:MAG: RNA polymerase factor sigma-54 [Gammaproteobacteria bacterium]|nr:RNA polymerase factor sigma-54 [Gammaproteobacteria bacterium]